MAVLNINSFEEVPVGNYKGALLQIDNVFYDQSSANVFALSKCVEFCLDDNIVAKESEFFELYNRSRREIELELKGRSSSYSRLLYFLRFSELKWQTSQSAFGLKMESIYWDAFLESLKPREGSSQFLEKMELASIQSCAISQQEARVDLQKILKLGISQYIDFIIPLEELSSGTPKQQYAKALQKLELEPTEVFILETLNANDQIGSSEIDSYKISPI